MRVTTLREHVTSSVMCMVSWAVLSISFLVFPFLIQSQSLIDCSGINSVSFMMSNFLATFSLIGIQVMWRSLVHPLHIAHWIVKLLQNHFQSLDPKMIRDGAAILVLSRLISLTSIFGFPSTARVCRDMRFSKALFICPCISVIKISDSALC